VSSIRRFLVVVLLATITLINFLAALHGYRTSMAEAELLFDAQLVDIAEVLAVTASGPAAGTELISTMAPNGSMQRIAFQVWRGGVLESSSGVGGADLAESIAPLSEGYADVNFGGYRWRAYSRYVTTGDRWLIVAQRADVRFTLAESVILESILPIILGLPLVGLLIWVIVGRGLNPLRDLASEMGNKRSDDLSPVTNSEPPQELAVLIDSINGLLGRLDAAFEREKRFAADAAHELRTPISVLKVQLHNLLRDVDGDATQLRSLQAAVERMGHSVEQVLMLYRTTPDQFAASLVQLDLASLARQVIAALYPQLEAKHQQIELLADRAPMQGDAFAIQTLLTNLIENASKYSGENGEIRVVVGRTNAGIKLTVEDSGPGIPADQYDKVFQRFYRVGSDRHNSGVPGTGIGLAIVQHIAEIHGATISLGGSVFATGLAVNVEFPAAAQIQQGRAAS
jgi:two-component system sensor histidine kinase QseC